MKNEFKTMNDVWMAIYSGKTIYWSSMSYRVLVSEDPCPEKKMSSNRGVHSLRVTCMSNWFGSRLDESELGALFTEK